jgi:hypothetical protein
MLFKGTKSLDAIAEQVGAHRSSVHRHKQRCFLTWRSAKLKAKGGKTHGDGRLVALWPSGGYTYFGETIPASSIRPSDEILAIEYAPPPDVHTARNPLALLTDRVIEEAFSENAERETLKLPSQ